MVPTFLPWDGTSSWFSPSTFNFQLIIRAMKIKLLYTCLILLSLLIHSCNTGSKSTGNSQETKQEPLVESEYLGVGEVFLRGKELAGQEIKVKGIVEHVCKHTWKRFKIVDADDSAFIKVELGEDFPTLDASLLGHTAYVCGKLVPVQMDAKAVEAWEKKTRENHKGEEETAHFKEEIAIIQEIHQQIVNGEIPYHMAHTLEASSYEIR